MVGIYALSFSIQIIYDNQDFIRHRTVNQESYEAIMERLYLAGLQTYPYLSKDHSEILIKVRASLERLEEHAALIELPMLLDPAYLKDHMDNPTALVRDDPTQTNLTPYQFIHAKYQQGEYTISTNVQRLILTSFFSLLFILTISLCPSLSICPLSFPFVSHTCSPSLTSLCRSYWNVC